MRRLISSFHRTTRLPDSWLFDASITVAILSIVDARRVVHQPSIQQVYQTKKLDLDYGDNQEVRDDKTVGVRAYLSSSTHASAIRVSSAQRAAECGILLSACEALTNMFVVAVMACAAYQWLVSDKYMAGLQDAKEKKQNELYTSIETSISDHEEILNNITKTTIGMAEDNFNDHRRDFLRFLSHMQTQTCLDTKLPNFVSSLRDFLKYWLQAYEECSVHPLCQKLAVVSEKELDACTKPTELAALVHNAVDKTKLKLIPKATVQHKQGMIDNTRGLFPNVAFPIAVRVVPVFGVCIASLDFAFGEYVHVVLALLATVASPFILARFKSEGAALDSEIDRLEKERELSLKGLAEARSFFDNADQLGFMWVHRTIPRLDILTEVQTSCRDLEGDELVKYVEGANVALGRLGQALGPVEIWFGDAVLPLDDLKVLSLQLSDQHKGISKRYETTDISQALGSAEDPRGLAMVGGQKHLSEILDGWDTTSASCQVCEQSFGFFHSLHVCRECCRAVCDACSQSRMAVPSKGYDEQVRVCDRCTSKLRQEQLDTAAREQNSVNLPTVLQNVASWSFVHLEVVSANNLKNVGHLGVETPSPYVRFCIDEEAIHETKVADNSANPVWRERFFLPARQNDCRIVFQVMSTGHVGADVSEYHFCGQACVNFREFEPGVWNCASPSLQDAGATGTFDVRVRFYPDAWSLVGASGIQENNELDVGAHRAASTACDGTQ